MNKKFSTLVAAILAAGAWTTANAVDVKPAQFTDAIKDNVLSIETLKDVVGEAKWDGKIELTGDVTLEAGSDAFNSQAFVVIKDKVVLTTSANAKDVTDKKATVNGRIVVTGEEVEISNLAVKLAITTPVAGNCQTAIKVYADKFTLKGNAISGSLTTEDGSNIVNGITLYPKSDEAAYTISGNKFSGFAAVTTVGNDGAPGGAWYSSALQVYQGAKVTPAGDEKAAYTTAEISFNASTVNANNEFEGNTSDIFVRNNFELEKGTTEAAYVTYDKNAKDGLKAALKDAVKTVVKDGNINFDGTAEEFAALTKGIDVTNVAVNTKDGAVTPGLDLLKAELRPKSEAFKVDLASSYVEGEYYLLVMRLPDNDDAGDHPFLYTDKDGKLTTKKSGQATVEEIKKDEFLWKVKSETPNKDGHIDYVFVNKKGVELKFCSANEAKYNKQGVALKVSKEFAGVTSISSETVKYFGLYRQISHNISASDMNALHNGGFYVNFDKTAGTEAFAGLLKAVGTTDNATEFVLKNEDGDYIKATAKNVAGKNIKEYVYAFELTEKVSEASTFRFFHTPIDVEDNHLLMTTIDSIQVKVRDNEKDDKSLAWATLGTYGLTTENIKTLGASIDTELFPVSINLTDYTVDPTKFLKNGFAVIKQLNEEGDLFVVATGCDNKISLAEAVVNDVEKQWAISYDVEKKVYKMVNRENTAVFEEIPYTQLRENGSSKEELADNIYVYGGKEYEITFVEIDNSDKYYKYLSKGTGKEGEADLKEKSFVMSYWSTVFDGYANVAINDKDLAFIGTEAEQAEFTAWAVDTVRAKSLINYYDKDKKEWAKSEPVLKAPVYKFDIAKDGFGLSNKKFGLVVAGSRTPMAIRVADKHYNLATVAVEEGKDAEWAGKVYVGNNDSYMYATNCLYDDNKNTMFLVSDNNRPEYRRLGKTVKDGLNDIEGDLNILKFFRTNDENQFLYENSANRNANNGEACLNFLGETNLADQPANAQLPFLVDTAFIRNNTRKPLYLLSVRNEFIPAEADVPCEVPGHGMNCEHATKGHPAYRTGAYLVALDDSTETYEQAKYQGNVRLAFVEATHIADTLVIASSKFSADKKTLKNDSIRFSSTDKKTGAVSQLEKNPAAFAFKLVDPAVDPEGDKAAFVIENVDKDGKTRWIRIHNTVPVLVDTRAEAAEFEVMAAAEGEEATANEGIATSDVTVIASEGQVTIAGAAGKKVVISNILGQVVANTVLASDNAVIAAPQGVVVVAVEGEEAVKAIVK